MIIGESVMRNMNSMKRLFLFFVMSALMLSAAAQDIAYRVNFKGKAPTISDFVETLVTMEEGEVMNVYNHSWQLYKKGQKLPEGVMIDVDAKNGYALFNINYPDDNDHLTVETCFWNCDDGRHKIIAQAIASYHDGRAMMGQYDGLTFYTYDSVKRQMKWTPTIDLCGEEFIDYPLSDGTIISLPQVGKDISLWLNTSEGLKNFKLKWAGNRFLFTE